MVFPDQGHFAVSALPLEYRSPEAGAVAVMIALSCSHNLLGVKTRQLQAERRTRGQQRLRVDANESIHHESGRHPKAAIPKGQRSCAWAVRGTVSMRIAHRLVP